MDKVRIGVLGAGLRASSAHVPNLLATGEVELTAVCRRTPEALQKVADRFGIEPGAGHGYDYPWSRAAPAPGARRRSPAAQR